MDTEATKTPRGRVLVVDDEPDALHLLEFILQMNGFEVVAASGGRAALAALGEGRFDAILLDVMMPEMDGFQVCAELKKSPESAATPVILVTARDDMETRARGMKLGVADYLAKPVNKAELIRRLATQVEARRRDLALEELQSRVG